MTHTNSGSSYLITDKWHILKFRSFVSITDRWHTANCVWVFLARKSKVITAAFCHGIFQSKTKPQNAKTALQNVFKDHFLDFGPCKLKTQIAFLYFRSFFSATDRWHTAPWSVRMWPWPCARNRWTSRLGPGYQCRRNKTPQRIERIQRTERIQRIQRTELTTASTHITHKTHGQASS